MDILSVLPTVGAVGLPTAGLIAILVWLVKTYNPKDFTRNSVVQSMLAEKDKTIDLVDAGRKDAVEALRVSENGRAEERATTRTAVETNRAIDYVLNQILPKRGDPVGK